MENKFCNLIRLLIVCVFALMMGALLIPQTVSAEDDPNTIYWASTSNELTISNKPVSGNKTGSFNGSTEFTSNISPWGENFEDIKKDIWTVKINGTVAPKYTSYWFSGFGELRTMDLNKLDLSNCVSMEGMFKGCKYLDSVNLVNANLSSCNNFSNMLDGCTCLQILAVDPNWHDLPTDTTKRITFPHVLDRVDVSPKEPYGQGVLVPEYISSDAGINIYTWSTLSPLSEEVESLVTVLKQIHALPAGDDPAFEDAVETAMAGYNALKDEMKKYVPASALTALQTAWGDRNQNRIIIKWSSIDEESMNVPDPITYAIPTSIRLSDFLSQKYDEICSSFAMEGYEPLVSSYYYGDILGYHPMSAYNDRRSFESDSTNWPDRSQKLTEFTILYFYSTKSAGDIKMTVDPLRCGTKGSAISQTWLKIDPEDVAKLQEHFRNPSGSWTIGADDTVKGGQDYCFSIPKGSYQEGFGYNYSVMRPLLNGKEPDDITNNEYVWKVTAVHNWDGGEETKPATSAEEGVMTYKCKGCNETKTEPIPKLDPSAGGNPSAEPGSDPDQKGSDGTPVGPGASAAAAERAITNMVSDSDPAGTVFGKLALKSPKQTKTSVDLRWNTVPGASSYVIYGNRCGKGIKPVKLAVVKGNKQTITTVNNQKVKKGTYYKFIMVALDKNNTVVSTSKVIHVATKGGKVGNHKKVTVKKSVIKKAKKLKKGKTLKLKAKAVPQSKKLKVRKHRAVLYESSNINIATVSKKGVVKAKNKGTCYIYAYAQNGVFKKIKVTVK